MQQKKRIQVECPIRHIEGNLVFGTDGWTWAYFEVLPYDYTYRPTAQKEALKKLWTSLFTFIQTTGVREIHILGLPDYTSVEQAHNQLKQAIKGGPLAKPAKHYLDQAVEAVKGSLKGPTGYRVFLGVRLQKVSRQAIRRNLRRKIYHKWHDFRRYVGTIAGIEPFDILDEELMEYQEQADGLYTDFRKYFAIKPVTTMDVQWMIRVITNQGITPHPTLRPNWKPAARETQVHGHRVVKPNPLNIWSLNNTVFEADDYYIKVKQFDDEAGEIKEAYLSFLHCFDMPLQMTEINRREWGYWVQEKPYDYPYSVRIRVIPNDDAKEMIQRQKLRLDKERIETRVEGQQIDAYLERKYQLAIEKEGEIREKEYPILELSAIWGVSAPDLGELGQRKAHLKSIYRRRGIELDESPGTQFLSLNEFFPGGHRFVTDFLHQLEPPMVGGAMFGATSELGDGKGFYVGRTGLPDVGRNELNKPVFLLPSLHTQDIGAAKKENSLSMLFVGKTGFGKSQSTNQVVYQCVLTLGAKVVTIDPKGERTEWVQNLPILKDFMNLITLGSDAKEDRGILDPYQIFPPAEAALFALDFLVSILQVSRRDDWYGHIHDAVTEVRKNDNPSERHMQNVILALKNKDGRLYQRLVNYSDALFAHLVFGDGKNRRTLSFDHPLNVLQIHGLRIPSQAKRPSEYNEAEALSMAIMLPVLGFVRNHMRQDPTRLKFQHWDEAWMPLRSTEGKNTLDESIREGRRMNAGAILATQNPTDVPDELWNNIGMRFVFNLDSDRQIEKALEMLRMEDTPANRKAIQELREGECFFRDVYGRVGRLYFDPLFENLARAFDTRPPDEIAQHYLEKAGVTT